MLIQLIAHLKRPRKYRAQGMVEFALILPVLLLVVFVIIELARVLHAWMAVENGARYGVRYAVTGEWDDNYCPGMDCDTESEEDLARIPSIKDVAEAGAVAILKDGTVTNVADPGFFNVTVCSSKKSSPGPFMYSAGDPNAPSASQCSPSEDAGGPGDTVLVSVDFTHPLITPMISALWPDLHLRAQRTGIVEQYRTSRVVGVPVQYFGTPATSTPIPPTNTPIPTNTPPPTPTPSRTPTPTPTPSCSKIVFLRDRLKGDDFEVEVKNNNFVPAYLSSTYLEWQKVQSNMQVDKFKFNKVEYWHVHTSTSPIGPISSWVKIDGGGKQAWWEVDFRGAPDPLWGTYSVDLVFGFNDMSLTCDISGYVKQVQLPTSTPKPTRTPGPTDTPGPSPTRKPTKKPRSTKTPTNPPSSDTATPKPTIDFGD